MTLWSTEWSVIVFWYKKISECLCTWFVKQQTINCYAIVAKVDGVVVCSCSLSFFFFLFFWAVLCGHCPQHHSDWTRWLDKCEDLSSRFVFIVVVEVEFCSYAFYLQHVAFTDRFMKNLLRIVFIKSKAYIFLCEYVCVDRQFHSYICSLFCNMKNRMFA